MATLQNRIRALEVRVPPSTAKRLYSVIGGGTADDAADFVRSEGWAFDHETDMIIHIAPLAPDFRDGRVQGAKASDDPEINRLRFMLKPTNPDWRRDQ